ncbi:F0F1 ATP synthase subunit B [Aquicella lusitana]|uniref:ATP synthase subunit b n=1 Tax=Aquicella lusitana TaxID=254246 RepID=A0A370GTB0_9COXI|nr:F0F1 ATP synthase subunit B [Aquicella lusitana]RDI46560.1 ATP synthase F0 subcomplex B subunit [Aquicella lusitana]VVC74224.1 ATP synthase subunit b [Aquicella lusitana]
MDINATIIGQFITFSILVWFTMRYVWPPITKAMHDREKKIAAGLEAAERSKRELELAEHKALSIIRDAKQQATHIIEQANLHSSQLIDEAKVQAKQESQRIVEMAQSEIDREVTRAKEALKTQLATLAVAGAEKIIQRNIDPSSHQDLLNQLAAEI